MKIKLSGIEYNLNEAIYQEIIKADAMYGNNNINEQWLSILFEETGEVAHAINELRLHPENKENILDNLNYELIQVIATCIRWLKDLKIKS